MPFESLPLEDNSSYLAVLPNKAYVFSIRQNMCKEGLAMGKNNGKGKRITMDGNCYVDVFAEV